MSVLQWKALPPAQVVISPYKTQNALNNKSIAYFHTSINFIISCHIYYNKISVGLPFS